MQRLPEVHDRTLAMAGGEWIDLATGRAILESWFDRVVPLTELSSVVNQLLERGLVVCRASGLPLSVCVLVHTSELGSVQLKSTDAGDRYLAATDGAS